MVVEVNVIVVETLHKWQSPVQMVQIQHCKTLIKFLTYEFIELGNFLIQFFNLQDWGLFAHYKNCGFKFFMDCFDQSHQAVSLYLHFHVLKGRLYHLEESQCQVVCSYTFRL